jgi:hypothetical protein
VAFKELLLLDKPPEAASPGGTPMKTVNKRDYCSLLIRLLTKNGYEK